MSLMSRPIVKLLEESILMILAVRSHMVCGQLIVYTNQSQVANVVFTRGLAKCLAGTNVNADAIHPGYILSYLHA